ncbi:2-dehydro-3-deoxygalactonokinase [Salipiger bermudensis]|uniref:2-dehydro-3-deoxygalactonokinase n=1 Tax=Salipiger bermudensis TaxID=344736 RepID=UPI001C99A8D0|nr:2-dehydro-3-deoxygalactonokinase [Salipiger bermudensis]MBY6005085.1 2-dehydro-3-deoxygalactonokinase [Salipiger bermudensis]
MSDTTTALIALDWGTSSLRGFRLSASGAVLETRASGHGIQHLPEPGEAGFEAAFSALCGDWLEGAPVPVVAGGMVGSAQGWREVPYLACPTPLAGLHEAAERVITRAGVEILLAPGLIFEPEGGTPEVMRGEEIQIAGTLAGQPDWQAGSTIVLPGTHCKWADIRGGSVAGFATYMTGELFALLRGHSILGRLMSDAPTGESDRADAFARGIALAAEAGPGDLTRQIFSTRTLGLTGQLPGGVLADYCSGLLIGHEIVSGLRGSDGAPIVLVGSGALCTRYAEALRQLSGQGPAAIIENPAPAGLHRFARDAGLL